MIDQGYVGHVDPYGYTMYVELLNLYAISYSDAGEIVGRTSVPTNDASLDILTAFMNSPEHRADILSADFTSWAWPKRTRSMGRTISPRSF